MPKISVVIPAYNAAEHICEAIESVLKQTHPDLEVIVVDDGSKDGTGDLVRARFPLVICITKPNGGASSARNVGCRMATGEYIAFLDADDAWHPQKTTAQVALMAAYPQADLSRVAVSEETLDWREPLMPTDGGLPVHSCYQRIGDGFEHPFFATSAVLVRRTAFLAVGGFDESLNIAEDIDFFLKVMAKAPCVPMVSAFGLYKRPIKGSLGDDSEAGYVRLFQVYERFLKEHPQCRADMGQRHINQVLARLRARYAASQYRNGRGWDAARSALTSMRVWPNALALRVLGLLIFKPRKAGA